MTHQNWTPAEIAALKDGRQQGLTIQQIVAQLPGRTYSVVAKRMSTLGLTPRTSRTVKTRTSAEQKEYKSYLTNVRAPFSEARARARMRGKA